MKIANSTIKIFQDSLAPVMHESGKDDSVKNKVFLPKGTKLPVIFDNATKEMIVDVEKGTMKELKEDMLFTTDSASVALQLQLRARDPQRYKVLERSLYFKQDLQETMGKVAAGQDTYSFRLFDRAGKAMLAEGDSSVPYVELSAEEFTKKVKRYHLGYRITNDELLKSVFAGVPLSFEKEDAVMRGFAERQNTLAYFGDSEIYGDKGLLNNASAVAGQVALNAGSTSRAWSAKTGAEIVQDIITRAAAMTTASDGVIKPDTLLVPMIYRETLAKTYDGGNSSNMTIGEMIVAAMETANEGKPFKIAFRNELVGTYTGGLNYFALYEKDATFMEFLTAQNPTFIAPQYADFATKMLAYAYWCGTVIRYPLAISYGYEI